MPNKSQVHRTHILKVLDFETPYHINRESYKFAEMKGAFCISKSIGAEVSIEYTESQKLYKKAFDKIELDIFTTDNEDVAIKQNDFYSVGSIRIDRKILYITISVPEKDFEFISNAFYYGNAKFIEITSLELNRGKAIIINASLRKSIDLEDYI